MPWAAIIEMILKLIENCSKTDGRDKVFKRLRNPGFRERFALRADLRKSGLSGADLRDAVERAFNDLEAATDDEISDLLDSVK